MTEQERLDAMFKFTDAQWQQKQEEMSHAERVPMQGGKPMKRANIPEGEPPHGYICYRCGKKGHWIQACPTNDDASYDNKNRIKRTTGIPRSMLKKIDQEDIDKLDETQRQNLMVNAEGEYVFAQADEKAWKRHLEQVKAAEAAQRNVQVGNKELQDRGLECSTDKRLFVDPMKTPCCGRTYCHDCIENALLDSDLTCPGCGTENISLEALVPDEDAKAKIKEYQDEKSGTGQRSISPTASVNTPKVEGSDDARPATRHGSKSPVSANGQSKKRTASDANTKSPESLAAPAMKRQKSGEGSVAVTPPADNSKPSTPAASTSGDQSQSNQNWMPPDFSQMQNMMSMGMGFPMMGMPMMNSMPFMNPMMNGGMNGVMPNMMQPNMNMNMNQQFPNHNQQHSGNWNQHKNNQHRNKPRPFQQHVQSQQQQLSGLSGIPSGPKAMVNQASFNPPTGPSANGSSSMPVKTCYKCGQPGHISKDCAAADTNGPSNFAAKTCYKCGQPGHISRDCTATDMNGGQFSNQQRYTGKEEDNPYMRQPLNPQRQWQKNKTGRPREADYKEL